MCAFYICKDDVVGKTMYDYAYSIVTLLFADEIVRKYTIL